MLKWEIEIDFLRLHHWMSAPSSHGKCVLIFIFTLCSKSCHVHVSHVDVKLLRKLAERKRREEEDKNAYDNVNPNQTSASSISRMNWFGSRTMHSNSQVVFYCIVDEVPTDCHRCHSHYEWILNRYVVVAFVFSPQIKLSINSIYVLCFLSILQFRRFLPFSSWFLLPISHLFFSSFFCISVSFSLSKLFFIVWFWTIGSREIKLGFCLHFQQIRKLHTQCRIHSLRTHTFCCNWRFAHSSTRDLTDSMGRFTN